MTDLLIAVADGDTQFSPDHVLTVVHSRWPDAEWGDPGGELAAKLARQITIEQGASRAIVEVLASRGAVSVEGDDDLAADFLALLTQSMPIPEDEIAVMNWADDVVMLRQNMTPGDVQAMRD